MNARLNVLPFAVRLLIAASIVGSFTIPSRGQVPCLPPPGGLVSWWSFDENAADNLGANSGTLGGNPAFGAGKVGGALGFDGADDEVVVPPSTSLNVGTGGDFTAEGWIKPQNPNRQQPIFEWNNRQGTVGVMLWLSQNFNGDLYANVIDSSNVSHDFRSSGGLVTASDWHHVALTYNRTTGEAVIYLNGNVAVQRNIGSFAVQTSFELFFGRRIHAGGGSAWFAGMMDEWGLYNRSLDPAEIQAIFDAGSAGKCGNPSLPVITVHPVSQTFSVGDTAAFTVSANGTQPLTYHWLLEGEPLLDATNSSLIITNAQSSAAGGYSVVVGNALGSVTSLVATLSIALPPPCLTAPSGLVGWWPFDETGGDLLGAGSAALSGSPVFVSGKVGGALSFDGVDDGAAVPANAQLNVGAADGFSIEGWIKPVDVGLQTLLEWNNRQGSLGVQFYLGQPFPAGNGAGCLYADLVSANGIGHRLTTVGGLISAGTWQHIALTYNKSNGLATIYINGGSVVQQILGSFNAQTAPPYDLLFGHRIAFGGIQYPFKGGMDEMSLYARALPASEIGSIYSASASGKCNSGFPPRIAVGPQSRTVVRGSAVVFSVSASGTAPLAYQWLFNGAPLDGATSSSLSLSNVQINQSGIYSVAVTNTIGNTISSNAVLVVNPPPATVRVVSANGAAGAEVSVPIELVANGNENALGFSLSFSSSVLGFSSATLGVGAPEGAALFVNTNEVAAGRLGLVVGLPSDHVFPEGTQRVALVTFVVAPVLNHTNVAVNLVDQPTLRQLSDIHAQVLPSVFVGGTVSIADSQFEADVAPRPGGNRSVATIDWVQMGRFVARLDTISGSNEFQRADCAPRTTQGNGLLTASDWVQVGRYAVGLDPLTILGGPTEPAEEGGGGFVPAASGRMLSVAKTSIAQGQSNTVPLLLESQGDENAMSFSIVFDPLKLGFLGALPGSAVSGALLNLNLADVASGRLGVALALQPGAALSAGTREVLLLRFSALAIAPATTAISFTNAPVPSEVSDTHANALATGYAPASISVTPPPGPPLRISRSGSTLFIRWSTSPGGFDLEASERVVGTEWSPVPGVLDLGDEKLAILSVTGGERYFRLKKP